MDSILCADHVTKQLAGEVPVMLVNDASFQVLPGEFVAITGPSGSGKSSLLYLLGLLDRPTRGRVFLKGHDTSHDGDDALASARLSELGFVFQSHFLLPEFSAIENVMLPMRKLGRLEPYNLRKRAMDLLGDLGLGTQEDKLPHQLSGGQSQRVAIARALANDPSLILADEPTGNLDTSSSANVQEILHHLAREHGRSVIVVTHDEAFARSADRVVRIVDGRIEAGAASQ